MGATYIARCVVFGLIFIYENLFLLVICLMMTIFINDLRTYHNYILCFSSILYWWFSDLYHLELSHPVLDELTAKLYLKQITVIGSPDVFRLRKEPINSLSYVRGCVRGCVRQFRSYSLDCLIFFSDFLHEVRSPYHFE